MSALVGRAELAGTCVYLLLGPDEQGGTRCYIGETDVFKARLRYHDASKEFWRRAVVITSKDANLTKAHERYLESRLVALALQAGRAVLDNGTTPPPQALPEANASDMDHFIDQLQIVLPVLGVDAIRGRETVVVPAAQRDQLMSLVFHLVNRKLGVAATAQQMDGEFTMLAGSTVVADWHGVGKAHSTIGAYESYRARRRKLIADGSICVENGTGRVAKDIVFGSPSTPVRVLRDARAMGELPGSRRTTARSAPGSAAASRQRMSPDRGWHPDPSVRMRVMTGSISARSPCRDSPATRHALHLRWHRATRVTAPSIDALTAPQPRA